MTGIARPRTRDFAQIDVFTGTGLLGNPVAVVLDSEGLDTATMQRFTDWTNLSEATFLGPPADPSADYSVRIFCPGRELPFAGHPTLGTCHAWLAAGGRPHGELIIQECGVGLVPLRHDEATGSLAFAAPPRRRSGPLAPEELSTLIDGLGVPPEAVVGHSWCDNGPGWQALLLDSAERVLAVVPDPQILAGLDVGIVGPHSPGDASGATADFEVRAFFPGNTGLTEDPVTGSLNAALAQWLIEAGHAPAEYTAAQGTAMGRAGRVRIQQDGPEVWVGGQCVTVITGTVAL